MQQQNVAQYYSNNSSSVGISSLLQTNITDQMRPRMLKGFSDFDDISSSNFNDLCTKLDWVSNLKWSKRPMQTVALESQHWAQIKRPSV